MNSSSAPGSPTTPAGGTRATRTLGVQRDISETLSRVRSVCDENSRYHVGMDLMVLLDEVLNNTIRAILIYDTFSGNFTDYEVQSLCSVIKYNKSVVAINMNGVEIGDGSVGLLCDNLVHSNVQLLDFSNTPLDDDAGHSLLALCHVNHSVRTVVVDDTLISEELMDDIDLACVYNEKSYPLPEPFRIDPTRRKYCAHHVFGACPNGLLCPMSHDAIGSMQDYSLEDAGKKKAQPSLPPAPEQGASWKPASKKKGKEKEFTVRLDKVKGRSGGGGGKRKGGGTRREEKDPDDEGGPMKGFLRSENLPYVVLGAASVVVVASLAALLLITPTRTTTGRK